MVDRLASIHCTVDEVAAVLGVSRDTIDRRFRDRIDAGKAKGRASLRREQWKAAEGGNPAMLIWLGKQYLGQVDKEPDGIVGEERPTTIVNINRHGQANEGDDAEDEPISN